MDKLSIDKYAPIKRHYETLPSGKKATDKVERFEQRYADTSGKKETSSFTVQNPVEFANARGRARGNAKKADVKTMSKKSEAFFEGFRDLLREAGCDEDQLQKAAYDLASYQVPYDYPSGGVGMALGTAIPIMKSNIEQLTDLGEHLLQQEAEQSQRGPPQSMRPHPRFQFKRRRR